MLSGLVRLELLVGVERYFAGANAAVRGAILATLSTAWLGSLCRVCLPETRIADRLEIKAYP